jgi:hypothetical protein
VSTFELIGVFSLSKPIFAIDFSALTAAYVAVNKTVMQFLEDWKGCTSQYSAWKSLQFFKLSSTYSLFINFNELFENVIV